MGQPAIQIRNVGKRYRIGSPAQRAVSLPEAISRFFAAGARRLAPNGGASEDTAEEILWALHDVSFDVAAGEVLGIVGRNGAGKSTLLKLLSRITQPSQGEIDLFGRVGSLLEVGTGFHPELSGRENIYLNGAILGMRRSEIQAKFADIVEFAEVERFLDTPVKRYSSGMYTRLAFAVAAHLEPEILIVDEVLAVGDAAFQKKCLGKMEDVGRQGRTVLFVSHNMAAVQKLCHRVIWLEGGTVREDGRPSEVVSHYLNTSFSPCTERVWAPGTAPGNERVRLHRASVRPVDGSPSQVIDISRPLVVEFEYENLQPGAQLNLSVTVNQEDGTTVFATAPVDEPVWHGRPFPAGHFRSAFTIPANLLNDGTHRIDMIVVKDGGTVIWSSPDILIFEARDDLSGRSGWFGRWPGTVRPQLPWTTELLAPGDGAAETHRSRPCVHA